MIRPANPETAARNHEIVRLRREGLTLDEIARRFGITRARVGQIAKRGGTSGEAAAVRKRGARRVAAENAKGALIDGFRAGREMPEVAEELGLTTSAANEFVREVATAADRAERRRSRSAARSRPKYSQNDLITAIQTAARHLGGVPSNQEYAVLASEHGLPSLPTLTNRFGTWLDAVQAAGLTPKVGRRRTYTRRWDEAACWQAVAQLFDELGEFPTADQYDVLASSRDDLPSLATVRNRLGRWSEVRSRLLDTPHPDPILGRLGVSARAEHRERNEQIWLGHLAGDVSDEELVDLLGAGLFDWDPSYGPRPS